MECFTQALLGFIGSTLGTERIAEVAVGTDIFWCNSEGFAVFGFGLGKFLTRGKGDSKTVVKIGRLGIVFDRLAGTIECFGVFIVFGKEVAQCGPCSGEIGFELHGFTVSGLGLLGFVTPGQDATEAILSIGVLGVESDSLAVCNFGRFGLLACFEAEPRRRCGSGSSGSSWMTCRAQTLTFLVSLLLDETGGQVDIHCQVGGSEADGQ